MELIKMAINRKQLINLEMCSSTRCVVLHMFAVRLQSAVSTDPDMHIERCELKNSFFFIQICYLVLAKYIMFECVLSEVTAQLVFHQ